MVVLGATSCFLTRFEACSTGRNSHLVLKAWSKAHGWRGHRPRRGTCYCCFSRWTCLLTIYVYTHRSLRLSVLVREASCAGAAGNAENPNRLSKVLRVRDCEFSALSGVPPLSPSSGTSDRRGTETEGAQGWEGVLDAVQDQASQPSNRVARGTHEALSIAEELLAVDGCWGRLNFL